MSLKISAILIFLFISLGAGWHFTHTKSSAFEYPDFFTVCSEDSRRLCNGIQAGEGRIKKCLEQQLSEASESCQKAVRGEMKDIPPATFPESQPAVGAEAKALTDFAQSMNGIRFGDYLGFQDNWKLVTVRYRKDSGEQRFTFANDLALKALSEGTIDYPDGAVFAKIGIATVDDPGFPSSSVPAGAKRFQFMVRNHKRYASTDGWGYAIFNGAGVHATLDPENAVQACFACHKIVKDRGEVFSQLMMLKALAAELPVTEDGMSNVIFEDVPVTSLPQRLQTLLGPKWSSVRSIQGPLLEHVFEGTLDESRPILIREFMRTGKPAVLMDPKENQFIFAREATPEEGKDTTCPAKTKLLLTRATFKMPGGQNKFLYNGRLWCEPISVK